jgi:hypothetical protein
VPTRGAIILEDINSTVIKEKPATKELPNKIEDLVFISYLKHNTKKERYKQLASFAEQNWPIVYKSK